MTQDNPWKRQAKQQNNQPVNAPSSSQQNNTPSWMKKKDDENGGGRGGGNQPSWMKKDDDTISTSPVRQTQPAWMRQQGGGSGNSQAGNNLWKAGGAQKKKEQEQKAKKEEEEKLRIKQEQQLKKELQNQQRQLKTMAVQEELSRLRQQSDKLQTNNKSKDNKSSKKHSPSKRVRIDNSAKRQIQSDGLIDKFLFHFQQSTNKATQYKDKIDVQTDLLKLIQTDFSHAVRNAIVQLMEDSKLKAKKVSSSKKNKLFNLKFQTWSAQVHYGLCEGRTVNVSANNSPQNSQATIVPVSSSNSIEFDMSGITRLQNVFDFYNDLASSICSVAKRLPSVKLRVPLVTLIKYKGVAFLAQGLSDSLIEQAGASVSEFKQIQNEWSIIQKDLKQPNDNRNGSKGGYQLNRNDLQVKRIVTSDEEEVYVVYLKNWDIKKVKHHSSRIEETIQLLSDNYLLSRLELGPVIHDKEFQKFEKLKTQPKTQLAQVLHFAQAVYIVYCSCQAEIEESSFWSLILSQSEDIWQMISHAGYKGKVIKKHLVFQIFEAFSGVKFQIKPTNFNKQRIRILKLNPKVYTFELEKLQVLQLTKNYERYLRQSKLPLAIKSFQVYEKLFGQEQKQKNENQLENQENSSVRNEQQPDKESQTSKVSSTPKISETNRDKKELSHGTYNLELILKKGCLLLSQKLYQPAIAFFQQIVSKLGRFDFMQIALKMELLAIFIKQNLQKQVLSTFQNLLSIIELYYGSECTLMNCTLYQMLGSFYSSQQHREEAKSFAIKFFEHSINIMIKFNGDQSAQLADIYLSRAIAFMNLKEYDLFFKDIDSAIKIFKNYSKYNHKIAECYFYKGKVKLIQGQLEQGLHNIENSAAIYAKISRFIEAIDVQIMAIQALKLTDKAWSNSKIEQLTQKIFQICFTYKNVFHFSKTLTTMIPLLDQDVSIVIKAKMLETQNDQQQDESQEGYVDETQLFYNLNDLEQIMKGFSSFSEMLRWLNAQLTEGNKVEQNRAAKLLELIKKFYKSPVQPQTELEQIKNECQDQDDNIENSVEQPEQQEVKKSISNIQKSESGSATGQLSEQ